MKKIFGSIVAIFVLAQSAPSDDWPGWRGDGSGISKETGLMKKWSTEEGVLWRTPIPGKGVSSPVVNKGRVFLTTAFESTQKNVAKKWVWLIITVLGLPWLGLNLLALRKPVIPGSETNPAALSLYSFGGAPILVAFLFVAAVAIAEVLINVDGPLNYRFVTGSFSRVWLISGLVAAIAIVASLVAAPAHWVTRLFVGTVAFGFAFYFLLSTVNPNNWSQYKSHVIELSYATFGILLALAAFHRFGKIWLALGIGAALVSLAFVLYWHVTLNHRFCYLRYRVSAGIIAGIAVGFAVYQMVELIRRRGSPGMSQSLPPLVRTLLVILPLGIGAVQFYSANFFLSKLGVMRSLICLDAQTGQRIWLKGFLTTELERVVPASSYATPTPVADGENVYAYFGSPGVVCFDYQGKRKWINQNLPNPTEYGAATSPLLNHNRLIIVSDNLSDSYVIALDTKTGHPVWRTSRPNKMDSYGTPIITTINGRDELIVAGGGLMSGYDLANGKELWSVDIARAQTREGTFVVQSPTINQEVVYVGGDYRHEKLTAYRLSPDHPRKPPVQLWKTKRYVLGYASPLAVSNLVFAVNDLGILSCIDSTDGDIRWQERLTGSYSASPFFAEGYVYLLSDQGDMTVVAAQRDFQVISKSSISESCFGTPAVAEGRIFIRTTSALWCVGHQYNWQVPNRSEPCYLGCYEFKVIMNAAVQLVRAARRLALIRQRSRRIVAQYGCWFSRAFP